MARAVLSRLLLATFVFLVSSCYNPSEIAEELRFAREKPHEADLVGRWVPTTETLEDMRISGGYAITKHELVLNADNTFVITNMPDWWSDGFGESKKSFQSTSGNWRLMLGTGGGFWEIYLTVGTAGIGSVPVRNRKPPYMLHIGIGDPDAGHYMLFERKK